MENQVIKQHITTDIVAGRFKILNMVKMLSGMDRKILSKRNQITS